MNSLPVVITAHLAVSEHALHPDDATHPEYPIERTCVHLYEPFQLTFARHAQQVLPRDADVESEANHRGLVLRGETETALEGPVAILREYFGSQIRVGPPVIRYHRGTCVEEPHMRVRVQCLPEYVEAVRADLEARGASIVDCDTTSASGVVRVTAPLAQLLGYSQSLAMLTAGSAQEVMWLSHYAPVDSPSPGGDAA